MCITTGISAVVVPQDTADIESRLCRATEMAEHEDVETAKNSMTNMSSPFGAGTFPNKELKSSGFADQFSTSPNLSAQQRTHPQGPLQQFNVQGPPQQMFNTQGHSQLQFNIQGSNAQGSPPSGAVLLIGSEGNGKSTLGNFLFDPRCKNNKYFEVGTNNLPKTRTCKTVTQTVEYLQGQERSDDTSDGTFHDDDTASDDIPENTMGPQSYTSYPYKITVNSSTPSPHFATGSVKDTSGANEEVEMSGSLTIIDTPGLNETSGNDFEYMIDLITTLKEQKKFKACIFVLKSLVTIDQQSRDTIKYYATLLPDLFSHNCLIVLTHYATDSHTVDVQKHQGYDHDIIIENVKKEFIESSGICFTPIVFSIDCVPFGADEEIEHKRGRDNMLSYIFSLRDVHMTEFRVAKTKEMKDEDRKKDMFT